MLVLAALYCTKFDLELEKRLIAILQDLTHRCLDSTHDSDTKARNYTYFKQYLLTSNVSIVKTNENNRLIFDFIEDTVNKAMIVQQEYIDTHVKKQQTIFSTDWNDLMKIEEKLDFSTTLQENTDIVELRQDVVQNAVRAEYNEDELWQIALLIENKNFDCFQEFQMKNYLTQLLIAAHSLNGNYQSTIKAAFFKIDSSAVFQTAPVKLEDRYLYIYAISFFCVSHLLRVFTFFCFCNI